MAKLTKVEAKAKLKALHTAERAAYKTILAAEKAYAKATNAVDVQEPKLNAIIWGTAIALSLLIQSGIA